MNVITQSASPEINLYSIKGNSKIKYFSYKPEDIQSNFTSSNHVLNYSITESVSELAGNFKMSIYENINKFEVTKESLWSRIKTLDIVEIIEGENKFIGVIKTKNFRSSISGGKPNRILELSGLGIQSLFSIYELCLDVHAGNFINPSVINQTLKIKVNQNDVSVKEAIKKIWEKFNELSKKLINDQKSYIQEVLESLKMNFENVFDVQNITTAYPIFTNFFNSGNNTFYAMLRALFPESVYEIFSYFEFGEPKIKIRKKPFSSKDWRLLKSTTINPIRIVGYSINVCDSEVYTAFMAYVEGLNGSIDQYKVKTLKEAQDAADKKENDSNLFQSNKEKIKKYGYKLLTVNFTGFDVTEIKDSGNALEKLTAELKEWYSNIDEMLNGTIQFVTDMRSNKKILTDSVFNSNYGDQYVCKPQVGEVVDFLGLQFYVNEIERSWTFGEAPMTTLNVSRGGKYFSGNFNSEQTLKSDISKRFSEV